MTYYAHFENGNDFPTTVLQADEVPGEGWYALSTDDVTAKQFKLVNGSVVEWSQDENTAYLEQLDVRRLNNNLRAVRNNLLKDCDWTQVSDAPLSTTKKEEWATYRQALRDLPESSINDMETVAWPTQPTL